MYRYERKYLVPNERLYELRKRLAPFVKPDAYAVKSSDNTYQYTVRSVYFDTPSFMALHDKWDGIEARKKLRIRAYNEPTPGCKVFMEVKRKHGARIWKTRTHVPYNLLDEVLLRGFTSQATAEIDAAQKEGASGFLFHMHRSHYKPSNLIAYEREPFQGKFEPGLRITFDKNVRARMWPQVSELFNEAGLQLVWKDGIILEIKYFADEMPKWLRTIVQEFGLRHEALSKYATPFSKKDISVSILKKGF